MTFRPRRRPPDRIDWLDNEEDDDEEGESGCSAAALCQSGFPRQFQWVRLQPRKPEIPNTEIRERTKGRNPSQCGAPGVALLKVFSFYF